MELNICSSSERLEEVKALYLEAFPPEERKPFSIIEDKVREGSMEILCMEEDGRFLGLAIMILHGDIALLDYLAVSPESRGGGVGTRTLAMLKARYPERTLLLEIEDPDETLVEAYDTQRRNMAALYNRYAYIKQPTSYICGKFREAIAKAKEDCDKIINQTN